VRDGGWNCEVPLPGEVDLLIASHSTITIDWSSRDAQSGRLNRKRDIITFAPAPRSCARIAGARMRWDSGSASSNSRSVACLEPRIRASAALRFNPRSQASRTDPPGGGGGAPPAPGGGNGGSGTPDPNSGASDGGNTCDANYSIVIRPNGLLDLTSVVRPLREDEAEIALAGVFRNHHKLPTGDAMLLFPDGSAATRRENAVWISTRGRHRLRVETPHGRALRHLDIVELPIDTAQRQVYPGFIRLPEDPACLGRTPFLIADVGNGLAFGIRSVEMARGRTAIHLDNESVGRIGAPIETKLPADEADLATMILGGRKFHTLFRPGVTTVEASDYTDR
jgi:hypothetical protein